MGISCQKMTENEQYSHSIERELIRLQRKHTETVRILLLGIGESGKSTIFKQMKILQVGGGFSQEEAISYRQLVYLNIITDMKAMIAASERLNVQMTTPQNQAYFKWVKEEVPADGSLWNQDVGKVIKILWEDKNMQTVYAMRNKHYCLNDAASYFFGEIERFIPAQLDSYIPTASDILRTRLRTSGIEEAEFKFHDISFIMTDVGGQRSERRKWIHCFENTVTAVLFCASLSCYDQFLSEDGRTNAMNETIALFEEVANSTYFKNSSMILLLNKRDLFEEKIKTVDPKTVWNSNYTGGCNYQPALEFIRARFTERHPNPSKLFSHVAVAVDTSHVDVMFKAIRKQLLDLSFLEMNI